MTQPLNASADCRLIGEYVDEAEGPTSSTSPGGEAVRPAGRRGPCRVLGARREVQGIHGAVEGRADGRRSRARAPTHAPPRAGPGRIRHRPPHDRRRRPRGGVQERGSGRHFPRRNAFGSEDRLTLPNDGIGRALRSLDTSPPLRPRPLRAASDGRPRCRVNVRRSGRFPRPARFVREPDAPASKSKTLLARRAHEQTPANPEALGWRPLPSPRSGRRAHAGRPISCADAIPLY